MQQVEFNEAIIDERNEEIMEINRAVLEVNDVMKDLAVMVTEQQKDIGASRYCAWQRYVFGGYVMTPVLLLMADEVEVNITEGHEKVTKGIESLNQAGQYQKKERGKVRLTELAKLAILREVVRANASALVVVMCHVCVQLIAMLLCVLAIAITLVVILVMKFKK